MLPDSTRFAALLAVAVLCTAACGKNDKAAPRTASDVETDAATASAEPSEPAPIPDPGPSPLASVAPTADGWYDASPLLVSLRAGERIDTAKRAGLVSLESIPLYDLKVSIDPNAGTFDLDEQAYLTNQHDESLRTLVFRIHGNPNTAGTRAATRIRLLRGACQGRPCEMQQGPPSVITVVFEDPLPAKARVRVHFELTGVLERIDPAETGFFAQSLAGIMSMGGQQKDATYGLMSVCDGFVSMASFFPILARRDNGGWERPEKEAIGDFGSDDLANVRAQIDVPPVARIASPGTVLRSVLIPGAGEGPRRRFDVAAALVRDFSLFVSEKVEVVERRVGDVTVRSTFLEGNREVGQRVADVTESSLGIFERRFGPYPYAELDVVEAPLTGGAGGVEFSGLISVASMLYRPFRKDDPLAALLGMLGGDLSDSPAVGMLDDTLEFTTAHEVAHQWWHGLVGSDSRAHPFVDESLSQYSTLLYLEDRYGKKSAEKAAETQVRMNYLGMRLMGQPDGAVDRPASSFAPVAYAGLVYGKGPYFYRDARKVMGDTAFFAALRDYADQNRFRTAPPRGPLPFLARGAHAKAVGALARRWLDEAHGDKDLGPIDMKSMLGSLLGPDAAQLAPQAEEILKLLGPSSTGGTTSPGAPPDPNKVMKQLEQMLDSF
jgi:Peptidase family M1 domain